MLLILVFFFLFYLFMLNLTSRETNSNRRNPSFEKPNTIVTSKVVNEQIDSVGSTTKQTMSSNTEEKMPKTEIVKKATKQSPDTDDWMVFNDDSSLIKIFDGASQYFNMDKVETFAQSLTYQNVPPGVQVGELSIICGYACAQFFARANEFRSIMPPFIPFPTNDNPFSWLFTLKRDCMLQATKDYKAVVKHKTKLLEGLESDDIVSYLNNNPYKCNVQRYTFNSYENLKQFASKNSFMVSNNNSAWMTFICIPDSRSLLYVDSHRRETWLFNIKDSVIHDVFTQLGINEPLTCDFVA